VFNATFNNISVISWRSVLLVEEIGGPGENHRPNDSHWQTNVVSSTPCLRRIRTHNVSGDRYFLISLLSHHEHYINLLEVSAMMFWSKDEWSLTQILPFQIMVSCYNYKPLVLRLQFYCPCLCHHSLSWKCVLFLYELKLVYVVFF